jgi:NAD(P)-dependent dehydrogenase (short-subunit alcohol dehydrogenase family)
MNERFSVFSVKFKIKKRGGIAIPVQVDHEKSDQVENLFKQIDKEQNGRLDVLVNNAYKGVDVFTLIYFLPFPKTSLKKFEKKNLLNYQTLF